MDALDVVSRPFAAFFAEVFAEACCPHPDSVGVARLPSVDRVDASRDLCVECLHPKSDCVCD